MFLGARASRPQLTCCCAGASCGRGVSDPSGVICSLFIAFVMAATAAHAQPYPTKPIRIVTAEAGGGNDVVARVIARYLADNIGQQVLVDNRGGAGGIIAADTAAKASADGYTLLAYASNVWIIPLLKKNIPYDMRDFAPITLVARSPSTLVVHPSLPVKTVQAFLTLARARPGQLNYGAGGTGSTGTGTSFGGGGGGAGYTSAGSNASGNNGGNGGSGGGGGGGASTGGTAGSGGNGVVLLYY